MKRPLKKPDWDELGQLPLDLEVDETESGSISPDEARLRSETARQMLDDQQSQAEWYKRYLELRAAGFTWRVACYIAWASSPKKGRKPETQDEFARTVLGLTSDRMIWVWRKKNPVIDETVAVFQAAPLFEHRADLYKALIESATSGDYKSHQDRKIAFEMLGDYVPRMQFETDKGKLSDLSEVDEAELEKQARLAKSEEDGPDE